MYCLKPGLDILKVANPYGYYGFYGCSEYQIVDSKYVFKVKDEISFEEACFCEPVATVVHGIERLRIKPGEKVLVIGAGTMGILNAQIARYYGADVIISELSQKKLCTAGELGFDKLIDVMKYDLKDCVGAYTGEEGLDAVIIAVGAEEAYKQAIDIMSKGGRMLVFSSGYPAPSWTLDPNLVHYELLDIIGTYGCSTADFQVASEILASGKIRVDKLIDQKFPLNNLQAAFEAAAAKDAYRVSVQI
jgi:L-iditol 2-dehydrogenase